MPELRKDPILGRWVIIARAGQTPPRLQERGPCGRAVRGLPVLRRPRGDDAHGNRRLSRLRVAGQWAGLASAGRSQPVPRAENRGEPQQEGDGIYDLMDGVGAHEVIIESPAHHKSMATLCAENIREVIWVYRDRLVDLKKDNRLVHGMLFKNVGAAGRELSSIPTASSSSRRSCRSRSGRK